MMAVQRIKPHLVITIDATHATDTPGLNPAAHGSLKLGAGPVLTNGAAVHPFLFNKLAETGRASGIPLQKKSSGRSTGTDTDKMFTSNAGIPSALVSYPIRYMHSAVETADLNDINHTIDLLAAFVQSFDPTEDFVPSLEL